MSPTHNPCILTQSLNCLDEAGWLGRSAKAKQHPVSELGDIPGNMGLLFALQFAFANCRRGCSHMWVRFAGAQGGCWGEGGLLDSSEAELISAVREIVNTCRTMRHRMLKGQNGPHHGINWLISSFTFSLVKREHVLLAKAVSPMLPCQGPVALIDTHPYQFNACNLLTWLDKGKGASTWLP